MCCQRQVETPRYDARELERLVIAAFAQARGVQWYRYQNIRPYCHVSVEVFREQVPEHARERKLSVVLEVLNQTVHRRLVVEQGLGGVKMQPVLLAGAACRGTGRRQRRGTTRAGNGYPRERRRAAGA